MAVELSWTLDTGLLVALQFDGVATEEHSAGANITQHPIEDGESISDYIALDPRTITVEGIITNAPLNEVSSAYVGAVSLVPTPVTLRTNLRKVLQAAQIDVGGPGNALTRTLDKVGLPDKIPGVQRPFTPTKVTPPVLGTETKTLEFTARVPDGADRVKACYDVLQKLHATRRIITLATDLEVYPSVVLKTLGAPRERMDALRFRMLFQEVKTAASRQVAFTLRNPRKTRDKRAAEPIDQGPLSGRVYPIREQGAVDEKAQEYTDYVTRD